MKIVLREIGIRRAGRVALATLLFPLWLHSLAALLHQIKIEQIIKRGGKGRRESPKDRFLNSRALNNHPAGGDRNSYTARVRLRSSTEVITLL